MTMVTPKSGMELRLHQILEHAGKGLKTLSWLSNS